MWCNRLFLCITLLSGLPCTYGARIVDLTHPLNPKSITWPTNPRFNLTIMWRDFFFDDVWLENNRFDTAEHTGTHMDAPAHVARGKNRVHQVKLERLTGPGVVVDLKKKIESNVDYRLSVSDLKEWENRYGKIPEKSIVLMNSGWDKYQNDYFKAFGTTNLTDTTSYHFPGWHEDAVLWLVINRRINMIGVDTPSIDYGQSQLFLAHQAGAGNDLSMLESVANLDKIPPSGTVIYAAVTNILDGSGAPTRVFAVIDGNGTTCIQQTWLLLLRLLSVLIGFFLTFSVE